MSGIIVTPTAPRRFHVELREDAHDPRHYHVTVPDNLMNELQLPESDLERLVRESFIFLLEREPALSIMAEFSLDVISRYFPEYKKTLRERL
jgi:hypothetical protein